MVRIGLVLGAGGLVGAAFHDGVLQAIRDAAGWDARNAEVIVGTSAGAHVGAQLRAGQAPRAALRTDRPAPGESATRLRRWAPSAPGLLLRGVTRPGSVPIGAMFSGVVPPGRISLSGWIHELDRRHRGWPTAPLWLAAVRLRDGQRVVFGRDDVDVTVGQAVAASCAIPGWFTPVVIGGEHYVDGGAHSTTNLDLLAGLGLDLVVVSAPMGVARGVYSPAAALQARGVLRLKLRQEARRVRREGTDVIAFSPTASDLEVMGWNAMAEGRARAVTEQAYASAMRRLRERSEEFARLAA